MSTMELPEYPATESGASTRREQNAEMAFNWEGTTGAPNVRKTKIAMIFRSKLEPTQRPGSEEARGVAW